MTPLTKKQYVSGGGLLLAGINFILVWLPVIIFQIISPNTAFPMWLQKFYEFALMLQPSSFIAAFIAGNLIWNSLSSLLLTIIMALAGTVQFFLGGLLIGFIVYKIKNRN